MPKLPYANIEKGTLLIASPDLDYGIFSRSVVLLCEHSVNGSFGVIINKLLEMNFSEELIGIDRAKEHIRFLMGGPLQANQMMLLHSDASAAHAGRICDDVFLGGDLSFIQDSVNSEEFPYTINLCFGFVSWEAGQLEQAFFEGLWFITQGTKEYVFFNPVEDLWRTVLRNMGGKYAALSEIPKDLSLN